MTFLEMTLSGGVFILAIGLFRMLTLRRLPKQTFVALWWAAALRLLLPLELASPFSVYTLVEFLRPKTETPAVSAASPAVAAVPVPPRVVMIPNQPAAAPAPEPFPIWTALWAAGAALLVLWFLVTYIRWRRRFRESLPVDYPGLQTWVHLRRQVRLRATDQITAPLTYGLFRPVILLPKTLDLRDEEALTCVLAHELAHIRYLDGLFKLVLAAALCLHWFNPAAWLFYVLANRDMELRCDEAAVLALGNDSRERYALALLRLAEKECVPLCGFSQKNGMEERIKAIMRIQKKSLAVCAAALALAVGITTAFATSAAEPQENDREYLRGDGLHSEEEADLARISAQVEAEWRDLLSPYARFGLEWSFDDPDYDGNGLTMTFEGHEVRGIFDGKSGEWISEHSGLGAYRPDAVELYAMYDETGLIGLRLATEEEQKAFDQERKQSADALKTEALVDSLRYDDGCIYFTIPESDGLWNIWISGRIITEDGMGMSVHYLETDSEKGEWIPGETYSFEVPDAVFGALTLDVDYGNASYTYELTPLLPKDGEPLAQPELPEGKADVPEDGSMVWPVDGGTVSQTQGTRVNPGGAGAVDHNGVDIAGLTKGDPIYAAAAGLVDAAGYQNDLGNYVLLLHEDKLVTLYAHCDSVLVKQGDRVKAGQTIATVGSTGLSTGPHLHFQVLVGSKNHNPLEYFPYWDVAQSVTDIQGKGEGYPVYAADVGYVTDVGWDEAYGNYVEIKQDRSNSGRPENITRYSNCGEIHVKRGDRVQQGDLIANVGVDPLRVEYLDDSFDSVYYIRWKEEMTETYLVNGAYPKNSKGQTYGPYLHELVEDLPDLQEIQSNWLGWPADLEDGISKGYISNQVKWVYNSKLESMARDDVVIKEDGHEYVPLYDVEGNQIGLYQWR